MIKLTNLNKYYKSGQGTYHALRDINLELPDKGLVFIVGKSGSGKSTLLNVIGGIDSYDSGELIIDDVSTKSFNDRDYNTYRNTYIGFIFQEFNVIKTLSVYDNIALSLELHHLSIKENHEKIMNLIERVGLKGKEKRKMNEISGGERQRVAIARALIKEPKVIIADEPTGNLDSKNRDIVMNILKDLSKDRLVLIVTHDKEIATQHGDRLITVKDGSIINDETTHQEHINFNDGAYIKEQIKPSLSTSFILGGKSFIQNKLRYILIILLFSFSLIFAGSTVNLYLTDSSIEYAKYQEEYKNDILNISRDYTNYGYTTTTGFYYFEIQELKEQYGKTTEQDGFEFYKSMIFDIDISSYFTVDWQYSSSIERIIVSKKADIDAMEKVISTKDENTKWRAGGLNDTQYNNYAIYITDYVADCLNANEYFGETPLSYEDMIANKKAFIKSDQFNNNLYIKNIIVTGYKEKFPNIFNDDVDVKEKAAFLDNQALYNAIYATSAVYNSIISVDTIKENKDKNTNIKYAYDNVIYNCLDQIGTYENVKITTFDPNTMSIAQKVDEYGTPQLDIQGKPEYLGSKPQAPKPQRAPQMAVSIGFLEKVLGVAIDKVSFTYDGDQGNNILTNEYGNEAMFYVCGTSRIPTPMSFYVTGIVDSDEVAIYAPENYVHTSFSNYILTSYSDGESEAGFPIIKISNNLETNARIYNEMISNDISIDNVSFTKLLIVSEFIDNNLILFVGLFFIFCLFSILIIFNFIIINIKNSTKDIGIYMSLGMSGWRISLIYLFQVFIVSTISTIISLAGTAIFLTVLDNSFSSQALIDFSVIKFTFIGVIAIILLAYLTPMLAVIFPLLGLSKKKPIDIIKVS